MYGYSADGTPGGNTSFAASCSSPFHGIVHLLPKELDDKVVKIANLHFGQYARNRVASLRPASHVLRWPSWGTRSSAWSWGSEPSILVGNVLFRSFKDCSMRYPESRTIKCAERYSANPSTLPGPSLFVLHCSEIVCKTARSVYLRCYQWNTSTQYFVLSRWLFV